MSNINNKLQKLADFIIKARYLILIITLIITIFLGYWATKIQIDPDLLHSLPKSDPLVQLYNRVGKQYGGNNTVIIILETKNVFTPQVLKDVRTITDTLENMQGISSVNSLTNTIEIRSSQWGIEIGNLIDPYNLPQTKAQLDSLKKKVFSNDMYRGVLVSNDTTATAIAAKISSDSARIQIAQHIRKTIKKLHLHEKVYFAGLPFMMVDTNTMILQDLERLIPIVTLIIALILFLGFRSFRGVILPLLTVGIAVVWTIGLIALTGHKLSIVSDVIPVILLALGSAYSIHVLNRINETQDKDLLKALSKAIAYIITPVFLAYITTAFGFISFIFGSYLTTIKEFGIFSAIGITFSFILSITFVPSIIAVFHIKRKSQFKPKTKLVTKFLEPVALYVTENPWKVIFAWAAIAIIFAFGISKIQRKVDMVSYFKKNSPVRVAQEIVDKKFSGVSPVTVVFKGDVQSPKLLKMMIQTENYMKSISPYLKSTLSVADLIEQMNQAMGEGKKIPDSKAKIQQLWFLLDGQSVMDRLVNPDLNEAVIQAQFASLDTKYSNDFAKKLEQYAKTHSTKDVKILVTGLPSIYRKLDYSLLRSQFTSLLLAVVLMFLIVSVTMWSTKSGILSLTPLLVTIIFSFGFMGLAHIPLDTATVLVASVTMGVGIDYAVHIISHFRTFYQDFHNVRQALIETIKVSGNAIMINVLAVAFGFITLLLSSLVPIQNFGTMMALTMIVSGLAAITLLPALITLIYTKKEN